MAATLDELLSEARQAVAPQIVAPSTVSPGGVDPLGLRQINFGLMDRVFPNLNNVARHVRPYVLMTWAWRRVRHILERDKRGGATNEAMRDFVDRIEPIYAWSQFLRDGRSDIPGGQALRKLLDEPKYNFGGDEWARRRDTRRFSTGLISPLNYGPSLQSMGWLIRADDAPGVFRADPDFDPLLDAFEAMMGKELDHPAFNRFGPVTVSRTDAERWGKIWALDKPRSIERKAAFARLGGELAVEARQHGVALARAAYADLDDEEADLDEVRSRMADASEAWEDGDARPTTAADWRVVQNRQVFRLALEALFYWTVALLGNGPRHTCSIADAFLSELGGKLPLTARQWLLTGDDGENPVELLNTLRAAFGDPSSLPGVIVASLRYCLNEAPAEALDFEAFDRLPLARARKEAERWGSFAPRACMMRIFETWIMAQHTYWCVGRGLADARNRGKTILRLRIVMDEGGWTQTPGTSLGNPPEATHDRLETVISLLSECRKL
ncbi:septum formation inhibitor-activating ATPase [Sphingomonas carotinifaciens]|uniref:septum formation inhibitor-activating ATPase n=1 Tax=Sphingomonas carotinifaciens TaxID=1166323 RepID=UPI0039A1A93C